MQKFCIIILAILFTSFTYSQVTENDAILIKYTLIKDECRSNVLSFKEIANKINIIEHFISTHDTVDIGIIDSISGYKIIYITLPPKFPDIVETKFWAVNRQKVIKINPSKIEFFINKYIYPKIDSTYYKKIIEIYNKISFWGRNIKFYNTYDKKRFILKEDYDLYNKFYNKKNTIIMRKTYDIHETDCYESYEIWYHFKWNGFSVQKILAYKKF